MKNIVSLCKNGILRIGIIAVACHGQQLRVEHDCNK